MLKQHIINTSFEEIWVPLESAMGRDRCAEWMQMGNCKLESGVVVRLYKHYTMRKYLNLSDYGRAWVYAGGAYVETDREKALREALALH